MKVIVCKRKLTSKLKRKIIAEWQSVDVNGADSVQLITDAMALGDKIQINYENSGWRLIVPYGWNTSKDGNTLLMCYKDNGEVRSYRFDRVLELMVDESLMEGSPDQSVNGMVVKDYGVVAGDFELPPLPASEEEKLLDVSEHEQGQELPFDNALNMLSSNDMGYIGEDEEETNQEDSDIKEEENKENSENNNEKNNQDKEKDDKKEEEDDAEKYEKDWDERVKNTEGKIKKRLLRKN